MIGEPRQHGGYFFMAGSKNGIVARRYNRFIKPGEHFSARNSTLYSSARRAGIYPLQDVGRFRGTWGTIGARRRGEHVKARASGSRFIYETAISGSVVVPTMERGAREGWSGYLKDMVGCLIQVSIFDARYIYIDPRRAHKRCYQLVLGHHI